MRGGGGNWRGRRGRRGRNGNENVQVGNLVRFRFGWRPRLGIPVRRLEPFREIIHREFPFRPLPESEAVRQAEDVVDLSEDHRLSADRRSIAAAAREDELHVFNGVPAFPLAEITRLPLACLPQGLFVPTNSGHDISPPFCLNLQTTSAYNIQGAPPKSKSLVSG